MTSITFTKAIPQIAHELKKAIDDQTVFPVTLTAKGSNGYEMVMRADDRHGVPYRVSWPNSRMDFVEFQINLTISDARGRTKTLVLVDDCGCAEGRKIQSTEGAQA